VEAVCTAMQRPVKPRSLYIRYIDDSWTVQNERMPEASAIAKNVLHLDT